MTTPSNAAAAAKTAAATAAKSLKKITFPSPKTVQQWAVDELEYMGTTITVPKITELSAWETVEATFRPYNKNAYLSQGGGNQFNPLDIEIYDNDFPSFGKGSPIAFTSTLEQGLSLTTKQFEEPDDQSIYKAFTAKNPSLAQLQSGIAAGNWTGEGVYSNAAYAQTIASDEVTSAATLRDISVPNPTGLLGQIKNAFIGVETMPGSLGWVGGQVTKGDTAVTKAAASAVGGTIASQIESALTSSTAIRVLLVIVGLVIGFIALKELTESDHGPGQTISVPVSNAYQKSKSHAKTATAMAAAS
jgi:hypothetical protein